MPISPNKEIPPMILINTNAVCILIFELINLGFKTLSMVEIINNPYRNNPIPLTRKLGLELIIPINNKYKEAGIHTTTDPRNGISDVKIVNPPHNKGDLSPNMKYPRAATNP